MDDHRRPIYLDANATAPPLPEVHAAVVRALAEAWANPSSLHEPGRAARAALDVARAEVAGLFGAAPDEVVLTSGASESNAIALAWALASPASARPPRIIASAVEHPSLRDRLVDAEEGGLASVRWLGVDRLGRVDLDDARRALAGEAHGREATAAPPAAPPAAPALLTVQWANSETGVIQPIAALGRIARAAGVPFHVDAAQAAGRVAIAWGGGSASASAAPKPGAAGAADACGATDVGGAADASTIDLLSVSARKLHGPAGAGALLVRRGLRARRAGGGPQERGWRGGTEGVAGAVGLGVAARLAREALAAGALREVAALRDRLEAGLQALGAIVHGVQPADGAWAADGADQAAARLPNTTSVRFPGADGATLLLELAKRGLAASTGSACASGRLEPSHVLVAMGVDAREARGALRLSLSRLNRLDDVERCLAVMEELLPRVRKLG